MTPQGYYAWRRQGGGPWLVPCLITLFTSKHIHSTSLIRALVQVAGTAAKYFESDVPDDPDFDEKKIMPVIESMLVKDVFFKRKSRT